MYGYSTQDEKEENRARGVLAQRSCFSCVASQQRRLIRESGGTTECCPSQKRLRL